MSKRNDQAAEKGLSRRAFFGVATAGAAGAVGAAALTAGGATPAFAQTGEARTRARYRHTEHVETFYRTLRFTRPQE